MDTWVVGLIGASSLIAMVLLLFVFIHTSVFVTKHILPVAQSKSSNLKNGGRDGCRTFTLKEMQKYSEGFSNKIGEGTTNVVFKGILPDGMEVAIKMAKGDVIHSSDVEASSRFQSEMVYQPALLERKK